MALTKTGKKRAETLRVKRLSSIEQQVHEKGFLLIAGIDEVGRGPLAGPLVAAACILSEGILLRGINDSKKLTHDQRYRLYQDLILHPKIIFGIGIVEAREIDRLNIHHATLEAMLRAIRRLGQTPDFLLVDGKHIPKCEIPAESIIGGDSKVQAIAAASIIAKVTRDHIMIGYHELYPQYCFNEHKGYGTKKHLDALHKFGTCPIHRLSFNFLKGEEDDTEHDCICSSEQRSD